MMRILFSKRNHLRPFALIILTSNLIASVVFIPFAAADSCSKVSKDLPIKTTLASASSWSNLRNNPGSISFESNAIFEAAKDKVPTLKAPEAFCPAGCTMPERAVMFFRSIPNKDLTKYDDAAHCSELEKKTTVTPLTYETLELSNIESLNSWIGDLSQGEGKLGNDLYEKCDASCSPRFEYTIAKVSDSPLKYRVQAAVICGQARDKDDNQYKLQSFFRWSCTTKAS